MFEGFFWLFCFTLVQKLECIRHLWRIWIVSSLLVKVVHDSSLPQSLLLYKGMAGGIAKHWSNRWETANWMWAGFLQTSMSRCERGTAELWVAFSNLKQCSQTISVQTGPIHSEKLAKITSEEPDFLEWIGLRWMADWKGQVKWLLQAREVS